MESRLETIKEFLDEHIDLTLDLETIWNAIAMVAVITALTLFTLFMIKDKSITGYYLTNNNTVSGVAEVTCVYADAPWYFDDKVFCTQDINKAIESVKQLNETIK